jgi:hypothetical protein
VAVAVVAGSSGGWPWLVAAGAGYGWWRHQGRTMNAMAAWGGLWESQLILFKFPSAYDTLFSSLIVRLEKNHCSVLLVGAGKCFF